MVNHYHEVRELTHPSYDIGGGRVVIHLSDDNSRIVYDHTIWGSLDNAPI